MKKTPTRSKCQIGMRLDSAIEKEAMIIDRLLELKKSRREDWLRSLLVKGYFGECAEIRQLHGHSSAQLAPRRSTQSLPTERTTPIVPDALPAGVEFPTDVTTQPANRAPTRLSDLKAVLG